MADDKPYVSSIVTKYNDVSRVKDDVKVLNEILQRQGISLLIDVIANLCGERSIHWKFNEKERAELINNVVTEMRESLAERL